MDPLNAVVEPKGVLKLALMTQAQLDFTLDLPELRQWRRDGREVELRMLRVDTPKVHHTWPHTLQLLANGHEIFAVNPPEEGHKRRDVPQGISAGLRHGINSLSVRASDARVGDFALAVVLTRPLGLAELAAQVGSCAHTAAAARICDLLSRQPSSSQGAAGEEVVCLSSDTLRLLCPISMDRVEDPVRGTDCEHLQCFGLAAYLASNRQMRAFNNRWQCPVCSRVLRPPDLCRDAYVAGVLTATPPEIEEVAVAADGGWRCRQPAAAPPGAASPSEEGGAFDLDDEPATSPAQPAGARPRPEEAPTPSLMALDQLPLLPADCAKAERAPTPRLAQERRRGCGAPRSPAKRRRASQPPAESGQPPGVPMFSDALEISDDD